ncbi:cyclopropane fatty acyl phospholipid synthase [Granulosicoccus sp. 3-233]|uniref:cyclopropane fatty acyl phospholipid synthase n=1 Tax=Granulosicoccus sp. 3-233 TaxID=3417969 RepID=UPI003D33E2D3
MSTLRHALQQHLFTSDSATYRDYLQQLAERADIGLEGVRPWDMTVHNDGLWRRIVSEGSLGAGEAYMDGWWDCRALDELFARILRAGIDREMVSLNNLRLVLSARLQNLQTPRRAVSVAHKHYDLSSELYRAMLDNRMIYSCGYWHQATSLDEAQEAKLSLVCRKLDLQPGMRLLDIGCGWGGAARYAAENFGVQVTGITVSHEQARVAEATCEGLPVEIRVADYRTMDGQFDRIMSIGMFEHVGYKNYRTYFRKALNLLSPDGLFLLHTIGSNLSRSITDPWIEKYIFPNSMLPSAVQITRALEGLFVIEDWHGFGADYDRTLMSWHANLQGNWTRLSPSFDERFRRMWTYYLLCSAGAFRARSNQLWQWLLSPKGIPGGWKTVR